MCEEQIHYVCLVQTRSNQMCDFHKMKCAYLDRCAFSCHFFFCIKMNCIHLALERVVWDIDECKEMN